MGERDLNRLTPDEASRLTPQGVPAAERTAFRTITRSESDVVGGALELLSAVGKISLVYGRGRIGTGFPAVDSSLKDVLDAARKVRTEREQAPPSSAAPSDRELLRDPKLGVRILLEARQHMDAIERAFPEEDRLTRWAEGAWSEAKDVLYRRMTEADDPTMNYVQRWEQWYKVEAAIGVSEQAIATTRADMLEYEDPDEDPAKFNARLQEHLKVSRQQDERRQS